MAELLSPVLSTTSLEPCWCYNRRGNMCSHVTVIRHLHMALGARHSTGLLACSHANFLGSCQILQAKERQAGSQFLDKKPPRHRPLLQRYWRCPCGAMCTLACVRAGCVSLFLLLLGIFFLQKTTVLFCSVNWK